MKRSIIAATVLSLVAATFTITPALAWHVDADGCEVDPIATVEVARKGPFWDPYYIYTAKHTGYRKVPPGCFGTVTVPDESWAQGWTFTIDQTGQTGTRGDTLRVWLKGPAGQQCFTGSWSHPTRTLDEVERFCLTKEVTFQQETRVRLVILAGADGKKRTISRTLPREGCEWTTRPLYSKPYTKAKMKRVQPIKQHLRTWRAGPGGDYRAPSRKYQDKAWRDGGQVVCPRFVSPS